MGMAIGALAAILVVGDTLERPDGGCAPLVRAAVEAPARAADVAAGVALHGQVVHWSTERPVRVWIARRPRALATDRLTDLEWRWTVLEGAAGWSGVVDGLRVVAAGDSASADVRVRWVPSLVLPTPADAAEGALAARAAGRTALTAADGRAVTASVVLAMRAPDGTPYTARDVRAVAQHEFGHVLGLAHHASPRSVMAPLVGAERVTDEDRAALRLLYALPVGARCVAGPAAGDGVPKALATATPG